MPKLKKQKAHLNKLALDKKNNSSFGNENQLETNLGQFSHEESEESWFEGGIDRELDENSVKYIDILNESMKNYTSSSRSLRYIGNSSRTYCRKQSEAKKNAEKNGQLIIAFFEKSEADVSSGNESSEELIENNDKEMTEVAISDLEKQLKNNDFSNGYKLRLTAVLQYLKLIKLEWAQIVKGGDSIPFSNHGLHRKTSSLLDDEDIKLRIIKFLNEKKI
nr:12050_t:CDS:2 [Entrophospora candida]